MIKHVKLLYIIFSILSFSIQAQPELYNLGWEKNGTNEWQGDTLSFVYRNNALTSIHLIPNSQFLLTRKNHFNKPFRMEWLVELNFSTSSTNYMDLWIQGDSSRLNTSKNGFYIRLGGSKDRISLFHLVNGKAIEIIQGKDGRSQTRSSNNPLQIQWNIDSLGKMQLFSRDEISENKAVLEGEYTTDRWDSSGFLGLVIRQSTSSFFGKHVLKSWKVLPFKQDTARTSETIIKHNDISIIEILFNPLPYGSDFMEIKNNSEHIIPLKELSWLCLSHPEDTLPLPDIMLHPQEILAITPDKENLIHQYPKHDPNQIAQFHIPSLPDEGGDVYILHLNKTNISKMHFGPEMHASFLKSKEGVSLVLHDQHWYSSSAQDGYASPGIETLFPKNEAQSHGFLSINHPNLSPDLDGWFDQAEIKIKTPEEGASINVKIFHEQGFMVKKLASNHWTIGESTFFWDGTNQEGKVMAMGHYVVLAELILAKGEIITERLTIAITPHF